MNGPRSTSTSGTIQFTIAPSGNNNDYDWAVWNGSNCPPTNQPIRCSFAVSNFGPGGDNTGVNSTNNSPQTDLTEGVLGNQWTQDINANANDCYTICINNYGTGSDNFSLTFGGTATLTCQPLASELISFDCYSLTKSTLLIWRTASQSNVESFIIKRSSDGLHWNDLEIIAGAGNSSMVLEYSYTDNYPLYLDNYYKLIERDYNGIERELSVSYCYIDNNLKYEYYNILGQKIIPEDITTGIYFRHTIVNNKIIVEKFYKN